MKIRDQQQLIEKVLQSCDLDLDDDQAVRQSICLIVSETYTESQLTLHEKQQIVQSIYNSMRGLDVLQPLLEDQSITEIMVNGPDHIFVEKLGVIEQSQVSFEDESHLLQVIRHCFGRADRQINEHVPLADMRLDSGERVHAVLPPVALNGPVLTIRKFTGIKPDMQTLVEQGFLSEAAADYLIEAVISRQTIFLCGGTGSGKTTFLNILSAYIPPAERIITIEDSAELNLQDLPNYVRLEAKPAAPDGSGGVCITDLIRASLRMRPDRLIVGEVRGPEAFDMLQAMNTGHPGSLCTGHANSCPDMLSRLSLMILMAIQLPWDAIRGLIASALNLMVFLKRNQQGQRKIAEIVRIDGISADQFQIHTLFSLSENGDLRQK